MSTNLILTTEMTVRMANIRVKFMKREEFDFKCDATGSLHLLPESNMTEYDTIIM